MMTIQLSLNYEDVIELVEQLTPEEQRDLIQHLQKQAQQRELTASEKITLLRSLAIDVPLPEDFSLRREDWYDDAR